LLLARLVPAVSLSSIGVTSRLRQGWLAPSLIALLIAMAVPAVFFALGSRSRLTAEGWVYLSTMPCLAEELVFRGAFQSLLETEQGRDLTRLASLAAPYVLCAVGSEARTRDDAAEPDSRAGCSTTFE
jgi:hypothetical protein